MLRIFRIMALFCVGLAVSATLTTVEARPSKEQLDHAIRSTVLVLTLDDQMQVIATGSGSVVDPRGLVLTNFHVVGDTDNGQLVSKQGLVGIAMTRDLRKPAVPLFIAQVIAGDPNIDLALVQVITDVDGNKLKECLNLPTYEVGSSEALGPGDELTAIGFPGIGGQSYTITTGQVSGFETDASENVEWIKTDAEISPGNSGGSAVADDGTLIGVPTAGRVREDGSGKLGLIRPIELAGEVLAESADAQFPNCRGGNTSRPANPGTGAKPTGVTVTGRVLSADSGRPIAGAYFIVLKPGVKWEKITKRNLEQNTYDLAKTDSRGVFQTTVPLDPTTAYSLGVIADGYVGIFEDELVPQELGLSGNLLELEDLTLKRQ